MHRLAAFFVLASCLVLIPVRAEAVTYTWVGANNTSWTTSSSWSPPRTSAAVTDRMVFDNGTNLTVLNVPNTSIGQVAVLNGTQVTFRPAGSNLTMTLNGGAGPDFEIGPNCQLTLTTAGTYIIVLATGTTGLIQGQFRAEQASHRLLGSDPGAIVFTSGSSATAANGLMGNLFGIGGGAPSVPGSVIFQSGATYIQQAGLSPFGTSAQQVTVFEHGSLYRINLANVNIAAGGRTFANVEYNVATIGQMTGAGPTAMDSLIVKAGTLRMEVTGETTIRGAVRVSPGAHLDLGPTSGTGTIRFGGAVKQYLVDQANPPGLLLKNTSVIMDNPGGVEFSMVATNFWTIPGNLTFQQGVLSYPADGSIKVDGAITGASQATGWLNCRTITTYVAPSTVNPQIPFGTPTEYAGIDLTFHGMTDTLKLGFVPQVSAPPMVPLTNIYFYQSQIDSLQKLAVGYHLTIEDTTNWTSFDATLNYPPSLIDPGADPSSFVARLRTYNGVHDALWTPHPFIAQPGRMIVPGVTRAVPGDYFFGFVVGEPTVVNVTVQSSSVEEGSSAAMTPALSGSGSTLSFRVRLSEPAIQTVTVDYTTSGGTAAAGGDYAPQNGTLTFLPGDTVKVVDVPVVGEADAEGNETFFFVISNATGDAVISGGVATGTILDDDDVESPTVTVLAPNGGETYTEGSEIAFFWTANDNVGVVAVDLEVSRDGGATWEPIATDQPNSGSYLWTSTPGLTQQALLRVTAADHRDQQTSDTSDALWSIWATDDVAPVVPTAFAMSLASANPSRGIARLRLAMPREQSVRADVYDVAGRRLATLVDGVVSAGVHELQWKGEGAGAGFYFVDLVTEGFRARTRIVRLP